MGGKGATVNLFHSRARLFALRDIEETGENDGRTQSREIASKWRLLLRNLDRSRSIGWGCFANGMDECGVNDEFLGIGSSVAQKIIQDLHPSETYRQFL